MRSLEAVSKPSCHPEGGSATEGSTLPTARFFAALRFTQNDSTRRQRVLNPLLLTLICVVTVGCGSGSPYDYVKAGGKLTYDDGSPIPVPNIRLQFAAQDAPAVEGAHPRPAIANINAQGDFDCVTSYKYGDGLIPGKHKVAIEQAADPKGKLLVPKEYTSIATTPLVVDTNNVPLEIKVPKPKGR